MALSSLPVREHSGFAAPSGEGNVACHLLGYGLKVADPRCICCGRDFNQPRRGGEKFKLARPIAASVAVWPNLTGRERVFVGARIIIALVDRHLTELVDRSTAFIGDRVLVAMVRAPGELRVPYVLCEECGVSVLGKVHSANEHHYIWDWLADLRPRWFSAWRRRPAAVSG